MSIPPPPADSAIAITHFLDLGHHSYRKSCMHVFVWPLNTVQQGMKPVGTDSVPSRQRVPSLCVFANTFSHQSAIARPKTANNVVPSTRTSRSFPNVRETALVERPRSAR